MKKSIILLPAIILFAIFSGGCSEEEEKLVQYTFGDTTYAIDGEMFWYQSGMGGDPYIRLLTTVEGQDNPDLLKLYPNQGLDAFAGTYTWEADGDAGTYDVGYTANYAGMSFDWVGVATDGTGNLVITEVETGIYEVEFEAVMDIGAYDFTQGGAFIKSGSGDLKLYYKGPIAELEAK